MPAPVIAGVVGGAAKLSLAKRFIRPLLVLVLLGPLVVAPFVVVAAQAVLVSIVRPSAAACEDTAGGARPLATRVVFPLPSGTWSMTSPYGMRIHPIKHVERMHWGTDFGAPNGTPILAVMDGVVSEVVFPRSGNNYMAIESRDVAGVRVKSLYMHSWPEGIFVQPGMVVSAGDVIGTVGNAGESTGPHLHFEMWVEGSRVDPVPLLVSYGAVDLKDCKRLVQ